MKKKAADFYVVSAFLAVLSMNAFADVAVEKIEGSFPSERFTETSSLIKEVPSYGPDEMAQYKVKEGETMKDAMKRWTRTVGFSLVWQPEPEDGDIQFARGMVFENSFRKASAEFFEIIRGQSKFDAQLHSNGVLRVFVADGDK